MSNFKTNKKTTFANFCLKFVCLLFSEAVDLRNGQKVAIKKNKNVFQDLSDAKRILRETKLLSHFHHDDVVK